VERYGFLAAFESVTPFRNRLLSGILGPAQKTSPIGSRCERERCQRPQIDDGLSDCNRRDTRTGKTAKFWLRSKDQRAARIGCDCYDPCLALAQEISRGRKRRKLRRLQRRLNKLKNLHPPKENRLARSFTLKLKHGLLKCLERSRTPWQSARTS
jgi:hypothetical protein